MPPAKVHQLRTNFDKAAASIRAHLDKSVEHIIAAGHELISAKADKRLIPHGRWLPFLDLVGIGEAHAQMLMQIAKHPVLSNPKFVRDLPASWGTLVELLKLPADEIEALIAQGAINPKTTRAQAKKLREKAERKPDPKPEAIDLSAVRHAREIEALQAEIEDLRDRLRKAEASVAWWVEKFVREGNPKGGLEPALFAELRKILSFDRAAFLRQLPLSEDQRAKVEGLLTDLNRAGQILNDNKAAFVQSDQPSRGRKPTKH